MTSQCVMCQKYLQHTFVCICHILHAIAYSYILPPIHKIAILLHLLIEDVRK